MKVYEAIIASAPETLNARQGFGLVRCYRRLPTSVQKRIGNWSYPSEMNGREIFTFCHQKEEGETWFLLNRTGKATDFTGRSSYISHTICFPERELKEWIQNCRPVNLCPADILLRFPWETTWNKPAPEWIEENQLKELEDFGIQCKTNTPPPESGDENLLSAFSIGSNGRLDSKRCFWLTDKTDGKQQLKDFSLAWHSADPWKAFPDLRNTLGEEYGPTYELGDPWSVQFTTHLRSERPDPYEWVIVQLGTRVTSERMPLRQEGETWASDNRDTSENFALVVARCNSPKGWAKNLIQKKISQISEDRNKQESKIHHDFDEFVNAEIGAVDAKSEAFRQAVLNGNRSEPLTSEELSTELKQWRNWLEKKKGELEAKHAESENLLSQLNESDETVRNLTHLASQLGLDLGLHSQGKGVEPTNAWDYVFDRQADELIQEFFCYHVQGAREDEKARLREKFEELESRESSLKEAENSLKEEQTSLEAARSTLESKKIEVNSSLRGADQLHKELQHRRIEAEEHKAAHLEAKAQLQKHEDKTLRLQNKIEKLKREKNIFRWIALVLGLIAIFLLLGLIITLLSTKDSGENSSKIPEATERANPTLLPPAESASRDSTKSDDAMENDRK